jgi:FkbM family methyltransferase
VREQFDHWADVVGARKAVATGRDRLVDLLNGDLGTPGWLRRSRRDDYHLKLLLRFSLRADSNCLDVGASRGVFLRDFRRVAPKGHHIAYEPVPVLHEALTREFPEMDIRRKALSDHAGQSHFVHLLESGLQGFSRLQDFVAEGSYPTGHRTETLSVDTVRLDDDLPEGWLPDFVKIDVEGAELLALRGAIDTLRKAKPVIALEHEWHADTSAEIYELICQDVGLRLFDMDGHGPLDQSVFAESVGTRWNWIAHQ